jgi:hypothetical protein
VTIATSTAYDIIKLALKDAGIVGVGQTPLAEDANDALTRMNAMIAQWRRKRWLIYVLRTDSVVSTGAVSYTVGPAGSDIVIDPRPDKLESAFFRQTVQSQPNQIDYPLEIISSRESYNRIALKQLQSFPSYIFYESSFPVARIYPGPVPQAAIYSVFISTKINLAQFANLTTPFELPEEYFNVLYYNLAVRLASAYNTEAMPGTMALAKDALNVIRMANLQIATLSMPDDLARPGVYNPYSDQVR